MGVSTRQRWPFFAISALGLAIGLWGMQSLLTLSAPPPGYPVNPIVYPARVGPAVVGSADDLAFIAQSRPAGSILEIQSAAGTVHARLEPQITKLGLAIILLEGLLFFAVNLVVFAPRAERGPVRDLYWCTLLFGIATLLHGLYYPRSRAWTDWLLPAIWTLCLTALPVFFFRMTQTFPRSRKLIEAHPRLMRALWIGAGVLALWQIATMFFYFAAPGPNAWRVMTLPWTLINVVLAASIVLGCFTLYRSGQKLELAREREQIKWILWGFAIAALPYALLQGVPRLLGVTSPVPLEIDRLFQLAIPIGLALAVVRLRGLDIDILIRRSLIYGMIVSALALAYLLVGVFAVQKIAAHAPQYVGLLQLIAAALPVILYTSLRRWVGDWVDRTFFKRQHDYAQALQAFQEAVRGAAGQEEITEIGRRFLEEELGLESSVVMARRGEALVAAGVPEDEDGEALLLAAENGTARRLLASPNSTSRPDLETAEFPAALREAGIKVAVPLSAEGRSLGCLLAGEKKSERRFVEEDLKLLYAVRSVTESALVRLDLIQRSAREAFERESQETLFAIRH